MTTTFVELKEKLLQYDEVTLLELLDITSEELVSRFEDIIDDRYEELLEKIED